MVDVQKVLLLILNAKNFPNVKENEPNIFLVQSITEFLTNKYILKINIC